MMPWLGLYKDRIRKLGACDQTNKFSMLTNMEKSRMVKKTNMLKN